MIRPSHAYPLLLGLYPVASLIAHNRAEMVFSSGLRAILFSVLLAILLQFVFRFLIRDEHKSAILTAFTLLMIYSYGHLIYFFRQSQLFGINLGRHRILMPTYILLFTSVLILFRQAKINLTAISKAFTPLSAILVLFPLSQFVYSSTVDYFEANERSRQIRMELPVSLPAEQEPPNVYYIILDGYPRADFIAQFLGEDIAPFLKDISSRGFYIAHCAQAKYTDTRFSMAATLNMRYLERGAGEPEVLVSGIELDNMIRNNEVQQNFSGLG